MISRSTRRGLLLAAVLAAGSYLLVQRQESEPEAPIEGLDTRLDYALEQFEMRAYDEVGALSMRLWAPRLTNDATTDIGVIQDPRVEVRNEGFIWHIMAESATVSDDQEEVYLDGDVRVDREGALPSDQLRIDTQDVTIVVDARTATSQGPLRLEDLAGEVRATGFWVNMLSNEFQLKNDVQAIYELPR